MVYGDHGRKLLHPFTTSQYGALFPWKEFYAKSLHFRIMCRTAAVLVAGYGFAIYKIGPDFLAFTPYISVHHSISHKLAHDNEHARYPVQHKEHK